MKKNNLLHAATVIALTICGQLNAAQVVTRTDASGNSTSLQEAQTPTTQEPKVINQTDATQPALPETAPTQEPKQDVAQPIEKAVVKKNKRQQSAQPQQTQPVADQPENQPSAPVKKDEAAVTAGALGKVESKKAAEQPQQPTEQEMEAAMKELQKIFEDLKLNEKQEAKTTPTTKQ